MVTVRARLARFFRARYGGRMTPEKVTRLSNLVSEGTFSNLEVASLMVDEFIHLRSQLTNRTYELLNAAPLPVLREVAKEIEKCGTNDTYYKQIADMTKNAIARREAASGP